MTARDRSNEPRDTCPICGGPDHGSACPHEAYDARDAAVGEPCARCETCGRPATVIDGARILCTPCADEEEARNTRWADGEPCCDCGDRYAEPYLAVRADGALRCEWCDLGGTPDYGVTLSTDPRWVVEGTGGGCSGWGRADAESPDLTWLITDIGYTAPPEGFAAPVLLGLYRDGEQTLYAECATLADAVALAARFRGAR